MPRIELDMTAVRSGIVGWERQYPTRAIPNEGYRTIGVLVPLDEFNRFCAMGHGVRRHSI